MEGGDGQPKSWGCRLQCPSKCSNRSVVVFPHEDGQVRVQGTCKGPEDYPPNSKSVSIERR